MIKGDSYDNVGQERGQENDLNHNWRNFIYTLVKHGIMRNIKVNPNKSQSGILIWRFQGTKPSQWTRDANMSETMEGATEAECK